MKHYHHSPKRFFPPKAWRTRSRDSGVRYASAQAILKDLYNPDWTYEYPVWAKLAYERHWMTYARYRATGVRVRSAMWKWRYGDSPFLRMLPKAPRPTVPVSQTTAGRL